MDEDKHKKLLAALTQRLGIPDNGDASLQMLEQLRTVFSETIPYENLSVLGQAFVSLQPSEVLTKFSQKRGGYCFELNTAFGMLLKARGVATKMHLGRVWLRDPDQVPPRNHGTNVIEVEGKCYIADVGFGARAPRCLIPLFDLGREIDDGDALDEPIRAVENKDFGVMVQRRVGGIWANQYSLELAPAHPSDVDAANHFQSSSSTSHFRKHLFVGRFTSKGRDGLFDNRLTRRNGANTDVHYIESLEEMCGVLKQVFGIDPAGYEQSLKLILQH